MTLPQALDGAARLAGMLAVRDVLAPGPVLLVQGHDTELGDVVFDALEQAGTRPRPPTTQLRLFDAGHPWRLGPNRRWSVSPARWDGWTRWLMVRGPRVELRVAVASERRGIDAGQRGRLVLFGPADGAGGIESHLLAGGHPPTCDWLRSVVRDGGLTVMALRSSIELPGSRSEFPAVLLEATDAGDIGAVRVPLGSDAALLGTSSSLAYAHGLDACPRHARQAAAFATLVALDVLDLTAADPLGDLCGCEFELHTIVHDVVVEAVTTANGVGATDTARVVLTDRAVDRLGERLVRCETCGTERTGKEVDEVVMHVLDALVRGAAPLVPPLSGLAMFPDACWTQPPAD